MWEWIWKTWAKGVGHRKYILRFWLYEILALTIFLNHSVSPFFTSLNYPVYTFAHTSLSSIHIKQGLCCRKPLHHRILTPGHSSHPASEDKQVSPGATLPHGDIRTSDSPPCTSSRYSHLAFPCPYHEGADKSIWSTESLKSCQLWPNQLKKTLCCLVSITQSCLLMKSSA